MAGKFLLPALAFATTALAQGQCSGPVTIKTSADATAISACHLWDGDVTIDSSASGVISLDGLQTIQGDLVCHNATQVTELSGDQLGTIGGTFDLNGLTIMSTLQFGRLTRVNRIKWITLPALQSLNFNQGVSEANEVYISDTGLTSLSGIELTQVGNMDINNNVFLKTINVNDLTNVTEFLSFSANGMDLEIDFPNLQGAANLTFRNVSSISLPSLADVGGAIGFYSNYFEGFAAPNLTETGGTIAFVDNPQLNNISFPELTHVGGGLQLANNSKLETVAGFPALKVIDGDISFAGTFSVVKFGSLNLVSGAANIMSSSTNASGVCAIFDAAKKAQAIRGDENCKTGVSNPETDGSASGTSSGGTKSTHNFAAPMFDPSTPLTGLSAFIAALLFL